MTTPSGVQTKALEALVAIGFTDNDFYRVTLGATAEKILQLVRVEAGRNYSDATIEEIFTPKNFESLGFSKPLWTRTYGVLLNLFYDKGGDKATVGEIYALYWTEIMRQANAGRSVYIAIQTILREKCGLVNPDWKIFK